MLAEQEPELAENELVWLLTGCPEYLDAHLKLGEISLDRGDFPLARGHFGAAFQLALAASRRAGLERELTPYRLPANQTAHAAGKGLAYCLLQLGKHSMAREVVDTLLAWDPSDPLNVRGLLAPTS